MWAQQRNETWGLLLLDASRTKFLILNLTVIAQQHCAKYSSP